MAKSITTSKKEYNEMIEEFIKQQEKEKKEAIDMISNAEEKISYNKNVIYSQGIFQLSDYVNYHIFIDYDNNELGMLTSPDGIDSFWKIKLTKTTKESSEYQHIINEYYVQSEIPLTNPGKHLISFSDINDGFHRTIAYILFYEDGTIYFTDNIKENNISRYTGLNDSEFSVKEQIKYVE